MPPIEHLVLLPTLTAAQRGRLDAVVGPGRVDTDPTGLARADVAVLDRDPGPEMAKHAGLQWVHLPHAGLDGAALGPLLAAGMTVTTGAGRSAEALAEHALGFLIVGTGHTGRAVAELCAALGMRVIGHRRRDESVPGPFERVTSVDRGETVDVLLPEADAVVLTASLNDGTRHLIGEAQLAALPRGAFLVNTGPPMGRAGDRGTRWRRLARRFL